MYTALYMGSTRTQIYLTDEQRRRLDQVRRTEARSLAHVIRDAIDAYLESWQTRNDDVERILAETYGSVPDLDVPPRSDWDAREDRIWDRGGRPPRR
jgi:predicted transcriptional regulator